VPPVLSPEVTGVDVLELRVHCPGDHGECQALWLVPSVLTATPAAAEGKEFVGEWVDANIPGQPGMRAVWTIAHKKGEWAVAVAFVTGNKIAGTAEGTDIKFADGKLEFAVHHIKKVAPNWQDTTNVATVNGDKMEMKFSSAGGGGGSATLARVKK
jgi:hypothetical protein